jgi:rubredoxin
VDVRLEYTVPSAPCWPCNVSYSVSAAIEEDQYVAVGFKGMAYRDPGSLEHERPGYFGMATDEIDDARTGRAIVLGYARPEGSCVREMKAENYVGTPVDVDGNPSLHDASVERVNGRTVVSFVVEQHVGQKAGDVTAFFSGEQVSARVMWAIGGVESAPPAKSFVCAVCSHVYDAEADGGGVAFEDLPETWTCPVCGKPKSAYKPAAGPTGECREALKYHNAARGVSPLAWFNQNPLCKTEAVMV